MPKADRNVHWSPAARQDVRRIWRHYAQVASREVADKLLHDLAQASERTATSPLLWRARDEAGFACAARGCLFCLLSPGEGRHRGRTYSARAAESQSRLPRSEALMVTRT